MMPFRRYKSKRIWLVSWRQTSCMCSPTCPQGRRGRGRPVPLQRKLSPKLSEMCSLKHSGAVVSCCYTEVSSLIPKLSGKSLGMRLSSYYASTIDDFRWARPTTSRKQSHEQKTAVKPTFHLDRSFLYFTLIVGGRAYSCSACTPHL